MSSKADRSNSKDCVASGLGGLGPYSDKQQSALATAWPEQNEPPLKSKAKSIKLKKNAKAENSKKLIRQSSKDSVVLTGYKNLKVPHGEPTTKSKEVDTQCNPKDELDNLGKYIHQNENATMHCAQNTKHCTTSDIQGNVGIQGDSFSNLLSLQVQARPQAGTGAEATQSTAARIDSSHPSAGLRHIDVKPSDKDPYQGDKVTILLPLHSDSTAKRDVPEITQTDFSEFKSRVGDGVMFVGACGAALRSDCVPQASSRLSDSGIESESSSATQLAPVSPSPFANTCLEALTEPILPSAHQSPASRGANTLEGLNPESTSGISEVQSSLTSINSLPSDDEVDSEVTSRKSSILVQEQSLIFSGETHSLPLSSSRVLAQQKATISHGDGLVSYNEDSAIQPRCETNAPERPTESSETDVPGSAASGPEACCEPQTAAQSSTSVTSSTDQVKKGFVENYFGSRSSTDVSEISPLETAAVTLGIQTCPNANDEEEEEEEQEHEMIENGYYEETDGLVYVNGEEQCYASGEEGRCEDRGAEGRTLFYDHLGLEQLQETYIPSASLETQPSGPAPTSNDLCWYKSAPTAQMTAWVFFFFLTL